MYLVLVDEGEHVQSQNAVSLRLLGQTSGSKQTKFLHLNSQQHSHLHISIII